MSVNPNGEAEVLKIMFKQRTRLKKGHRGPRLQQARHQGAQLAGQSLLALRHPQDTGERARRLHPRRTEHLVRRGRDAAQYRRPRTPAGRVPGRRQNHRLHVQRPVLYHRIRHRPPLPGRYHPGGEVRTRPDIQRRILRRRQPLLLPEAFRCRSERQPYAVLHRRLQPPARG